MFKLGSSLAAVGLGQRLDQIAHGQAQGRQGPGPPGRKLLARQLGRMHDIVEAAAQRHRPDGVVRLQRQLELPALARGIEDIAEEGRQHGRRSLRPRQYAGKAQREAVDQSGARIVCDQVLAHQLVRAVAPAGRGQGVVIDHRRQRRPEHPDRAGIDQPQRCRLRRHGIEQGDGGVQVDSLAELEVRRLHAGDGGEMEHAVERTAGQPGQMAAILDGAFEVVDAGQVRPLLEGDIGGDDAVVRAEPLG